MLIAVVPLAFAAVAAASVPSFSIAQGPITSLTPSGLTVQANAQVPTSCTRASSSPAVAGFKVGDQVTINCIQGVLVSIAAGLGKPPLHVPDIPIPGLPESNGGVPVRGPRPTADQCVAAWDATAPLASREAIGAQSPLAATVGVESESLASPTPSLHTVATGPICSIWFALPGLRAASVTSMWKDGTARDWEGFTEHGEDGPTRGILSQAIVEEIAAASTREAVLLGKEEKQHWFWVSQNGTPSSAD
jgi:hypothetical protein